MGIFSLRRRRSGLKLEPINLFDPYLTAIQTLTGCPIPVNVLFVPFVFGVALVIGPVREKSASDRGVPTWGGAQPRSFSLTRRHRSPFPSTAIHAGSGLGDHSTR